MLSWAIRKEKSEITGGQRHFTAEEHLQQTPINHVSLQPPCSFPITPQRGGNHKQKRIWKVCIYFSWVFTSAEEVVCVKPKTWSTEQGSLCPSWPPDIKSNRLHPGQPSWLLQMLLSQCHSRRLPTDLDVQQRSLELVKLLLPELVSGRCWKLSF